MTPRLRSLEEAGMSAEPTREICSGCSQEIDPDCCGCGSPIEGHSMYDGHSPVPMGCACGYDKGGSDESTSELIARLRREAEDSASASVILRAENERLRGLINNPHTDDFLEAVRLEAAHQQERWGSEHDAGKTDADWFWLVGHLAGKAITKPEKQLHHIITTAAALLNWHGHKTGASTGMRPGILPPDEPSAGSRS